MSFFFTPPPEFKPGVINKPGEIPFPSVSGFHGGGAFVPPSLQDGNDFAKDFDKYIDNLPNNKEDIKRIRELMDYQNAYNLEREKSAREWSERMSNSAYSRAIADLRKNGINPYALLQGLNPATTPSATSYASSSPHYFETGRQMSQLLGTLVHSAFSMFGSLAKVLSFMK